MLAAALARRNDCSVTLSLAGRTAEPAPQPVPVRRGGFGGAEGLARYLGDERIDILIDATHPYAAVISANAAAAAREAGVKLLALRRPAWEKCAGDNWLEVVTVEDAVRALGAAPRRVFLALGRKELRPFDSAPQRHLDAARLLGGDTAEGPDALPDAVSALMRDIGMPNGIGAVGYGEGDVDALVEGSLQQQRLLATAPREVTAEDLAGVFRGSMEHW